jgi:hypothetical protein
MKKMHNTKLMKMFFTITSIIFILTAYTWSLNRDNDNALEETISEQSTDIAHLATQGAKQEQMNWDQWEDIGCLYTQMPYALRIITPMPPGVTITPTPYDFSDQDAGVTTTPTPSMSIDIEYPPDTRTGIDEINKVIDAIMGEDIDVRLDLVHLTRTACTSVDGLGGPPKCEPGETEGTIVDVFPVSSGEGHHVRPSLLMDVFDFTVRGVIAVYMVPEDAYHTEYWPAGTYGVIFTSEDGGYSHIITVLIESGRIVRLEFIPNWPPFDLIRQKSDTFILPPIR